MQTTPQTLWSLDQPNIQKGLILRRLKNLRMNQGDLADKLGISGSALSRGLESQQWLRARISDICTAAQCQPTDLVNAIGPQNGSDILQRVCGSARISGYPVPAGCSIRMLAVGDKWGVYLLAPPDVPVTDGDFVVFEAKTKAGVRVGQIHHDGNGGDRWVVTPGGSKKPYSVEVSQLTYIRLIMSALGGTWGVA